MSEQPKRTFGWRRDLPDFRDYTVDQHEVSAKLKALGSQQSIHALLKKAGVVNGKARKMPAKVDLRKW